MGYNTTVLVLNDALSSIENDPEFGKKLAAAIRKIAHHKDPVSVSASGRPAAKVIETHHADVTTVVAIGGNHGSILHETFGITHHHEEATQKVIIREMHQLIDCRPSTIAEQHAANLRPLENAQND